MAYKNTILGSMMIIAVGIAAWTTPVLSPAKCRTSAQAVKLPDAFMENVIAVVMDKQGKVNMKIVIAENDSLRRPDDTTYLTTPALTIYHRSPQPWYITSNFAKATRDDNVDFWDDVFIHHAADTTIPPRLSKPKIYCSSHSRPDCRNRDPITLMQPNVMVIATGMHANLNIGDIKLLVTGQTRICAECHNLVFTVYIHC